MATNVEIPESLISEVMNIGKFKTKREAINCGLHELLKQFKRKKTIDFFGKIEMKENYSYKELRKTR